MSDTASDAPRIAVLSEVVRNQIAAGEVIERPASVVRELLDNAIDAGARHITIELEEGGARLVRITDDGRGMAAADLELAFQAHATSKLRSPEDLDHIASLGFRGEALASMASIARCRIRSRERGAESGAEIVEEGGRRGRVTPAGMPHGTVVEVRDLFFNTPARRRFLKREQTELSRCTEVVQRVALAHPADEEGEGGIGFVLEHGGRRVFDVEPGMGLAARIRRVFGDELASALEPVEASAGTTRLVGLVAPPRFARRDARRQMWFLNGRPLRDKVLTRVLKDAYRGVLEGGLQPAAFLHLWMSPDLVDVNVHPAKSEVRLRDERPLFGFLVNALKEAVLRTDMSTPGGTMIDRVRRREERVTQRETLPDPGPRIGGGDWIPRPPAPQRASEEGFVVRDVQGAPPSNAPPAVETPRVDHSWAKTNDLAGDPWAETDDLAGPYIQVDRTYILRRLPDGFEIIDQHALHERLTFEELRADVREGGIEIQRLLAPELVELTRADVQLVTAHQDALRRVGLEVEPFGEHTVAVHGLPARLRRPDAEAIVRDVVDVISRTGKAPDAEDVLEEVLHRTSCRSSIMAGDRLDDASIRALLERARATGTDQTCPHARPTRVRFTIADLERAFHRS
ncbi:MAG: DNA mismatch repair endonuclease MutL [Planctomycetota bacterium]